MEQEKKQGLGVEEGQLSPELRGVLEEEAAEADIQLAIDAAAEEGIVITREKAIEIWRQLTQLHHRISQK